MFKKVFGQSEKFVRAFVRSFLLENGKPRNLVMLALLLATSWLMSDIYHFSTLREIPTAVLDFDQSSVSRTVTRYLDASTMVEVSPYRPSSMEEARRLMVEEKIASVVLIPSDFSANLKSGRQAEVVVASDMSNILIGRNVSNAISSVVGTVAAGVKIKLIKKLGEREDRALARAVPLVSENNYSFNAAKSYASYLVPGLMLFFLYVYMTLQYLRVIRSNESNLEKTAAFMGLVPHGVLLGLFFLYVYMPQQELTVHSSWRLIVALLTAGFFTLVLFEVAVNLLFRKEIFVMQASVFLAMLSLMFSGITWPTDMFPLPLQWLSFLLPFTPIAHGMRILVHFPAQAADLAQVFGLFFNQCVLFIALISISFFVSRIFRFFKKSRNSHSKADARPAEVEA